MAITAAVGPDGPLISLAWRGLRLLLGIYGKHLPQDHMHAQHIVSADPRPCSRAIWVCHCCAKRVAGQFRCAMGTYPQLLSLIQG